MWNQPKSGSWLLILFSFFIFSPLRSLLAILGLWGVFRGAESYCSTIKFWNINGTLKLITNLPWLINLYVAIVKLDAIVWSHIFSLFSSNRIKADWTRKLQLGLNWRALNADYVTHISQSDVSQLFFSYRIGLAKMNATFFLIILIPHKHFLDNFFKKPNFHKKCWLYSNRTQFFGFLAWFSIKFSLFWIKTKFSSFLKIFIFFTFFPPLPIKKSPIFSKSNNRREMGLSFLDSMHILWSSSLFFGGKFFFFNVFSIFSWFYPFLGSGPEGDDVL